MSTAVASSGWSTLSCLSSTTSRGSARVAGAADDRSRCDCTVVGGQWSVVGGRWSVAAAGDWQQRPARRHRAPATVDRLAAEPPITDHGRPPLDATDAALGADDRLRSGAVREDRRASPTCSARCRRRWRVSDGTSRVAMPRYRGVTAGTLVDAFPVTRRRLHARGRILRSAARRRRARAARRLPGALRSRRALRRRTASTIRTTRDGSRCWCAPRSSSSRGAGMRAGDRARARLAGRPRAGLSEDAVRRRIRCSAARRASSRFTISRIRGCSTPDWLPRLDLRLGAARRRSPGVLGPHQLPEGRHQRRRRHHDRQPALRARRFRRRSSASASTASCARRRDRSRRHPERHRHGRVGSGARSRSCRSRTAPTTWPGKPPPKRGAARAIRSAGATTTR